MVTPNENGTKSVVCRHERSRIEADLYTRRCLKVCCSVWSSSGGMVLVEIGLERRGRLVAKSSARVGHEIGIVFSNVLLATPDAPADDGNTTQQNSTTDTSNDTANDALGARAEPTTATIVVATIGLGHGSESSLACCEGQCSTPALGQYH